RSAVVAHVHQVLSTAFVEEVFASSRKGLRQRLLPLPVMAWLLVSFCLGSLASFAALLDELAAGAVVGLPSIKVSAQAFYQRLPALGHRRFLLLLQKVTSALRSSTLSRPWVERLAPWATGIFALDDTTLDALVRRVPELAAFDKGEPETL